MATIDISTAQIALLEDQYPGLLTTLQNSGVQPTAPQTLRDQLVQLATQLSPGVTTNLPGSLVEDMASTAIGALAQIDQAKVDTINSVSPLNATPSLLDEFGEVYGVKRGAGANPSAYVTFTGPPGLYLGTGGRGHAPGRWETAHDVNETFLAISPFIRNSHLPVSYFTAAYGRFFHIWR